MKATLVLLAVLISFQSPVIAQDMNEGKKTVLIIGSRGSELQQFAQWFGQDWKYLYANFYSGTELYLKSLSTSRRSALKEQLSGFLQKEANSSDDDIRRRWIELGAQAWQPDLDIREGLNGMLALM